MYVEGKACTICSVTKPFSEFYKNSKMKDGYHSYCKECLKSYSLTWGRENRKTLLSYQRKYQRKAYHTKWKLNPRFRLDQSFSTQIRSSLKGTKNGRRWETLVGYTLDDLMRWLEKKFTSEMNWSNYGLVWHVDHITPKSWFSYSSTSDPEFLECWKLSNLQPMMGQTNVMKGNKYVG